jgi:hypothetical protein
MTVSFEEYYARQIEWSLATFGPSQRTKGVLNHIRKECDEAENDPTDLCEWIDIMILAMDGYWRHGGTPETLMQDLFVKQRVNMNRKWPPPGPEDETVEHIRFVNPCSRRPHR